MTRAPNRNLRYALFALGCVVFGVALRLPVLSSGFIADDYVQLAMIDGTYPVERASWDLYNFSDGTPAETDALRHRGFFPWFTHREVRLSMFRPLSSELLSLDFRLFGNDPFPYHVHSALWWVAMVLAVAWLFGALLPRPAAFASLAFFVVDDANLIPFAWIANRCSVTSTLWGVLGLIAYVRHRERASVLAAAASAACFALAVGFGEYGLCFVAYVAAYELFRWLDDRRAGAHQRRNPLAVLAGHSLAAWPMVAPSLVFLALRHALGRGPLRSGTYIGPEGNLLGFLHLIAERVPVLFADLFFFIPSEPWNYGNLLLRGLYQDGLLDIRWLWTAERLRVVYSVVGVLAIAIAATAWLVVRRRVARDPSRERSPHLRWLATGSVLALLPVVGSFPSTRLLIIAEVGFAALCGTLVVLAFRDVRARFDAARLRTLVAVLAGAFVVALHFALPAKLTADHSAGFKLAAITARRAIMNIDADRRRLPLQRVVVLAALEYGTSLYIPIVLARHGRKPPRSCWTLSFAPAPHVMLRESATAFRLAPVNGYAMLANAPEQLFMDPSSPFRPGDVVDLGGLKVTVLETAGPHIQAIRVETDVPLDDPSLVFVIPTQAGIRRFSMPRIGEIAHVPEPVVPPL